MNRFYKTIWTLFLLSATLPTLSFAQGIQFNSGNWNSILQKAKAQNKLVFVDVYTSWCGPCKRMATQTFPQKEVGDFFNAHFICYKIDAEKGEGIAVAKKYEVTSFPTGLFLTGNGEVAYRFLGAKDAKEFLGEGNKALNFVKVLPQMKSLSAQYKAGKRDKDFLKEYVNLILNCGEMPGLPLTEYLGKLNDEELFAKDNLDKFNKITVYNENLFNRFAAYYIMASDTMKKKLERPIMKAIGGCIAPLTYNGKKEDITTFEQLLSVKESMKVQSNIIKLYMGGGTAYLPDDELRISFYEKADPNKYKTLVPVYMEKNVRPTEADSIYRALDNRRIHTIAQIDSLKALNDTVGVSKIMKKWAFTQAILSLGYESEMDFIVATAQHYWSISDKSEATRKACEQWGEYAYKIYSRSPVAEEYAQLLVDLNYKDKAKATLLDVLNKAKSDPSGKIDEIRKAEDALKKIQ
jgi:thiol-disulfide isomerase/thioredoxin